MTVRFAALALAGCPSLEALPPEQPCVEAGYAISSRTFECTGDEALANARYLAFREAFTCVPIPPWHLVEGPEGAHLEGETGLLQWDPPDAFHCAFAIRQLPCEQVELYGDDLDQWLTCSAACARVTDPVEGR